MYECDPNIGKFRKFQGCIDTTTGEQNAWQIEALPLKASTCDAWCAAGLRARVGFPHHCAPVPARRAAGGGRRGAPDGPPASPPDCPPVSARYQACKNDYFCTDETREYFSTPDNQCKPGRRARRIDIFTHFSHPPALHFYPPEHPPDADAPARLPPHQKHLE